jgi:hypothetical protein
LTRAVELGGANETALLFLQRLGHLDTVASPPRRERSASRPAAPRRLPIAGTRRRIDWLTTAAASIGITVVILLGAMRTASWLRETPVSIRASDARDPLPIVRAGEQRIDRAQTLRASGRLREALRELDVVELGDPLRPQADRLRSEIQRLLLSAAPEGVSVAGGQSQ